MFGVIYLIGAIFAFILLTRYFFGKKTIGEWVFIILISITSWAGLLLVISLGLVRNLKDNNEL